MKPYAEHTAHPSRGVGAVLDASVTSRLRMVATRLRGYLLIEGVAWVLGFLLVSSFVQFLIDYSSRGLRWSMRAALLAAIIVGALRLLWRRVISPLHVPVDPADIANLLERRFPELSSVLVSAVRFASGEVGSAATNSPTLIASVVGQAGQRTQRLDFNTVLNSRRARRAALTLVAIAVLTVLPVTMAPTMLRLWFARNVLLQEVPWPQETHLVVELQNGELIGARGDDVVVAAYAEGVQPREVEIFFETESGRRGRETMVTVGNADSYRYRYTIKNAREDFRFHLEGGDDVTETFQARLLERPKVERAALRIVPPVYSRLEPFTAAQGQRSAQLLPGSVVTFTIETNKPITRATLMAGSQAAGEAIPSGDRFVATAQPAQTQTYRFALLDEHGLENRQPVRFALRVIKDEPPRVRIRVPGVGEMITPQAILPIELECADTYGLASAELVFRVTRDDTREGLVPLPDFEPHMTTFATSVQWPVATEGAAAGERLALFARGADFDDVSGPNLAKSPETVFRVVTPDELLAELTRREQEFRMDFERLVDAQEQLRGGLLTLLGPTAPPADSEEFATTITSLERRQRSIAGSVNVVRQQVEQVLGELRINRLATQDAEQRLGGRIAEPLAELVRRDLVIAAETINRWAQNTATDTADLVDPQQISLLSQMREILASMIQWEGYQEAVNMLRDILRLQNELRTETSEAAEKQAGEVFED